MLIGWLDNPNLSLAVGQFITVTVELPPDIIERARVPIERMLAVKL